MTFSRFFLVNRIIYSDKKCVLEFVEPQIVQGSRDDDLRTSQQHDEEIAFSKNASILSFNECVELKVFRGTFEHFHRFQDFDKFLQIKLTMIKL